MKLNLTLQLLITLFYKTPQALNTEPWKQLLELLQTAIVVCRKGAVNNYEGWSLSSLSFSDSMDPVAITQLYHYRLQKVKDNM